MSGYKEILLTGQASAGAFDAERSAAVSPFDSLATSGSLTLASLRPASGALSSGTLGPGSARYSPYSPASGSATATPGTATRTPSAGRYQRMLAQFDYFSLKPRSRDHHRASGGNKATSAPPLDLGPGSALNAAAAAAAAAAVQQELYIRASQSLPSRSAVARSASPVRARSGPVGPVGAAADLYPLEVLALLFTLGVQQIWSSSSIPFLRSCFRTASGEPREDDSSARMLRFYQWSHNMLSRTRLPAFAVLSALVYLHRLCSSPSHANSSGLPVDPGSDYRVASTSVILANKFLDDNRFTNKTWSTVTGFSVPELTRMEVEFASSVAWNLSVSEDEWTDFVDMELADTGLWGLVTDLLQHRHPWLDKAPTCALKTLTILSRRLPHDKPEPTRSSPSSVTTSPLPPLPPQKAASADLRSLNLSFGSQRIRSTSMVDEDNEALRALAVVQARHRQATLQASLLQIASNNSAKEEIADPKLRDLVDKIQLAARLEMAQQEGNPRERIDLAKPMSIDFIVGGQCNTLNEGANGMDSRDMVDLLLPLRKASPASAMECLTVMA